MYLGIDNRMMLVYEGGGGAHTLRSLSSYNIIPELEEIQALVEFRRDVSRGPDTVRFGLGQSRLTRKPVSK